MARSSRSARRPAAPARASSRSRSSRARSRARPSYSLCTKHKAGDATAAKASSRTLQLLHASAKGKFSTKGKYSAATVLGTKWTVADRCDGTLTHDITDSVKVTDFVHHKTITLHAGSELSGDEAVSEADSGGWREDAGTGRQSFRRHRRNGRRRAGGGADRGPRRVGGAHAVRRHPLGRAAQRHLHRERPRLPGPQRRLLEHRVSSRTPPAPATAGRSCSSTATTTPSELFGPDFANHAGGTHTTAFHRGTEMPFTPPCSQTLTGSGTAASPYQVTTTVTLRPTGNVPVVFSSPRSTATSSATTSTGPTSPSRTSAPSRQHRRAVPRRRLPAARIGHRVRAFEPNQRLADHRRLYAERPRQPAVGARGVRADHRRVTPLGAERRSRRSGATSAMASFLDTCDSCRGTTTDNADGHRVDRSDGSTPGQSHDVLDSNTTIVDTVPAGGFSFSRQPQAVGRRHRRHDHRPEYERHRERVLGDDQLGRRHHLPGNGQRQATAALR